MKMKYSSLFVVALLVLLPLVCEGRPEPSDPKSVTTHDQEKGGELDVKVEKCEAGEGEEECLIRRTLVAHTDYIYTQGKHN